MEQRNELHNIPHSMGALAYFPKLIAQEMEITGDMSTDAKLFNTLRKTNPTLEKLRSIGKRATLTPSVFVW